MSSLATTSHRSNENPKKDRIGGTSNIAHGDTQNKSIIKRQQQIEAIHSKASSQEKEKIESYFHNGPSSKYHNDRRRANLRHDDTNPNSLKKLTHYQKRSLDKRKNMSDRAVKANISRLETKRLEAAVAAADAELVLHTEQSGFIEPETEMDRTYRLTQKELKHHVDEQTAKQIFDLNLDQYSPYGIDYDRSGRCGILYGTNGGHIALMDMHTLSLKSEFHLNERVRDATFLHNPTMLAVAQKQHAFIYDDTGAEIHRLSDHQDIFQMEFLPHHWLLSTIGRAGFLKYHDTSIGNLVSTHKTKMGPCSVMTQNKSNAIITCGHLNGTVTMWSPANSEYLAKILCHKGAAVQSLAIDKTGHYMVTGGADSQIKIWDVRMYKETHAYYCRGGTPSSLDISQKGVLGIGHGCRTTFWSPDAIRHKVKDPYMSHSINGKGPVHVMKFRPYEDVCGIGHNKGFSSIVIPGSGEPTLDSMEYNTNPYQDKKQRREGEVRALLDKLSPDMIAIDPDVIGTVEESDPSYRLERQNQIEEDANARKEEEGDQKVKEKKRMRGRNKIRKKLKRRKQNVVDENLIKLREMHEMEQLEQKREEEGEVSKEIPKDEAPAALKRFFS